MSNRVTRLSGFDGYPRYDRALNYVLINLTGNRLHFSLCRMGIKLMFFRLGHFTDALWRRTLLYANVGTCFLEVRALDGNFNSSFAYLVCTCIVDEEFWKNCSNAFPMNEYNLEM